MIKSKIVIVAVAVLSLLNSVAFAQESSKADVIVTVMRDGVKTEHVMLSKGRVQIEAFRKKYNDETKMYELTGRSAVTIIQSDKNSLRFAGKGSDVIQVQAAQIEDQIDAGGYIEVDHFAPIRELAKEIQAYPRITSFRVKWYFSVFSYHSGGVALYDKKAGTITEYIREGDWDTGGFYHTLFRGVTDEILNEMAQDVKDKNVKAGQPNQTAPFYFGNLTRYGCTSENLK